MIRSINLPRALLYGGGSIKRLGSLLTDMGLQRPLVVADKFLASPQSGAVDKIRDALVDSSVSQFDVFVDTIPDPTTESVERCVDALQLGAYDSIVALGGGSPMDTAKAAACLFKHGGKMRDYKAPYMNDKESLPIVAVPTTAGTGSEATRFTIVTDSETHEKMLCVGLAYLPIAAILDYELTLTKPFRLTADTGIDAICHAMEAFVSAKHNPVADGFARDAMSKLGGALYDACHRPADAHAREQMLLGSCQAGMAFSNSSVTLIHGMSRPLGAKHAGANTSNPSLTESAPSPATHAPSVYACRHSFHIPHGMCNAMLLPRCTSFSAQGSIDRYAESARVLGLSDARHDDDAAGSLALALQQARCAAQALSLASRPVPWSRSRARGQVTSDLKVPTLQQFGVQEEAFRRAVPKMASDALASGSPANNPIVPSSEELEKLFHELWDHECRAQVN